MFGLVSAANVDDHLFGVTSKFDAEVEKRESETDFNFTAAAIHINSNVDDSTAVTADVRGKLRGASKVDTYTLAIGVVHYIAFQEIYASGTTARGIKLLGYN